MAPNGSDTENISATESLINAMTKDPDLYPRIMALLPKKETLEELRGRYLENRNASVGGEQQKALLMELSRELSRFTVLVRLAAENDATLPQKLGINLQKGKKISSKAPLTAPGNFIVRHGPEHGTMIAKASPVKGGRSYDVEDCEGDPSIESNWKHIATSVLCSKMEIKGLTPGTIYWFRVKAIGAKGLGPASSYVSLMAI